MSSPFALLPRLAARALSALRLVGVTATLAFVPAASAALAGTVSTVTFTGPITGKTINFSLYLPPGYTGGTTEYPVVYHLHGINGTHSGNQISTVPASHEAAVTAGVIDPVIIVFPDGYLNAFWADSHDGAKPAETNVLEIITYVDSNYRTLASRDWRAMQGYSMGGFGAAKFAAKFPDKFCVGVIYDGALLSWPEIQTKHPGVASSVFNNNQTYFNQYSPWHWVTQNAATLAASVPFRQVVGALGADNQEFRNHLLAHGITPEYVETGCAHTPLSCLFDNGGEDSWDLIAASFGGATTTVFPPGVAIEDGWVLQSAQGSLVGGSIDNDSGLFLGDDASNRQYKVILSFDTSGIPDTATIVAATLKLKRSSVAGTNPFTSHGTAHVDIHTAFGGNSTLAPGDWQAPATTTQIAVMSNPTTNGSLSTGTLNAAGRAAISKTGKTQFRVYLATSNNNDNGNDYVSFYSTNNGTAANRPVLEITYQ